MHVLILYSSAGQMVSNALEMRCCATKALTQAGKAIRIFKTFSLELQKQPPSDSQMTEGAEMKIHHALLPSDNHTKVTILVLSRNLT